MVPVNFISPRPLDPSLLLYISQVGDGLPGGEPLLGQGKCLPAVAFDVPRHPGCDLIGRQFAICHDPQDFIAALGMMLFELGDPAPVIGDQPTMAGESEVDIEVMNAIQTVQIALKGILNFGPALNIGRDID